MHVFLLVLFIFSGLNSAIAATTCSDLFASHQASPEAIPEVVVNEVVAVFKQHGLNDGELDMPRRNIAKKWTLDVIQPGPEGTELLIMRRKSFVRGEVKGQDLEFDVLVRKNGKILLFEEALPIPDRVVAKISAMDYETRYPDHLREHFYYAEFSTRSSVIAALKSVYTGLRYWGFSGYVVEGKAPFDPTPNRKWRVVDAEFDLRRGQTAEIGDIQSFHLDDDFEKYSTGTTQKVTSTGQVGGWVAPWGRSAVIELVP